MVEMFEKPLMVGDKIIKVTVSIGISLYPIHGNNEDMLIKKADEAMYQIKRQGKSNFKILCLGVED